MAGWAIRTGGRRNGCLGVRATCSAATDAGRAIQWLTGRRWSDSPRATYPADAILSSAIQSAAAAVLIPSSSASAITWSVWSKICVTLE